MSSENFYKKYESPKQWETKSPMWKWARTLLEKIYRCHMNTWKDQWSSGDFHVKHKMQWEATTPFGGRRTNLQSTRADLGEHKHTCAAGRDGKCYNNVWKLLGFLSEVKRTPLIWSSHPIPRYFPYRSESSCPAKRHTFQHF